MNRQRLMELAGVQGKQLDEAQKGDIFAVGAGPDYVFYSIKPDRFSVNGAGYGQSKDKKKEFEDAAEDAINEEFEKFKKNVDEILKNISV